MVEGAHGPVAEVQLAATEEVQTSFTTVAENTTAVADPVGCRSGVLAGAPAGGVL